jgi:lipoprotein
MYRFLTIVLVVVISLLLSGCWTIYETPPVALDCSQKFDLNLKLEGFELVSLRQTGFSNSSGSATAYSWQNNSTATAYGNSTTAHYEYRPDDTFAYSVTDTFESLGFNIRSDNPELTLVGRIGSGRFDWGSPWLYLRDGLALLVAFPTFMMIGSYERFNDVRVLVYDIEGKKIADYYSKKSCYVFSLAFPFANFGNEKAYEWYGDRKAAEFSLMDCVNQFLADLKAGKFDNYIKKSKE